MVSADDDISLTFNLAQVITYTQARKEIKDAYIQSISGITPAGSLPEGLIST